MSRIVDAKDAGDGQLSVNIHSEQNHQKVDAYLTSIGQGAYNVAFTPLTAGLHRACIHFNGEDVAGKLIIAQAKLKSQI